MQCDGQTHRSTPGSESCVSIRLTTRKPCNTTCSGLAFKTRLKSLPQPGLDVIRFIKPLLTAILLTNLQARHFDLTTASLQRGTMLRIVLGVAGFNVQPQPGNFLTHLDAERASFELVQGKVLAGLVNTGLLLLTASDALGRAELLAEQHERRQNEAQGAEKITNNDSHG